MRTKKRVLRGSVAVAALAVLIAACGGGDVQTAPAPAPASPAAPAPDTGPRAPEYSAAKFAISTLHPDGNWQSSPWRAYAEAVQAETGDAYEFDFFFSGSLATSPETTDALVAGIADLAYPVYAASPANYPIDVWISNLSFLSDNRPVVGNLQSYAATLEWGFENREFIAELEAAGLAPLLPRFQLIPEYHLICTRPVVTLNDFQGLRVRTGGPAWATAAESLGMSTVTVATGEIFETMQRGVVDCSMNGYADFIGLGLWDVATHTTSTGFAGWASYGLAMGKPRWDALSLDGKQVFWDNLDSYMAKMLDNSLTEHHRFVVEGASRGLTFHTLDSAAQAAIADYHASVLENVVAEAPVGRNTALAMVESYVRLHEKWLNIAIELGYETPHADYSAWATAQGPDGHTVDVRPFVDRIVEEILVPNRPS